MPEKKIVILGAGLTGLSCSYHFKKHRVDTVLFEKEKEIGGLCRSKKIEGFIFDYDGHLLHFKTNYASRLVRDLLGNNLKKHLRNSSVFCFNKFIPYPFQANLWALPFSVLSDCILGFLKKDKVFTLKDNNSFLNWIYTTFGEGIARYFMVPYNQKFWCFPLKRISCDWIDGYIPLLSTEDLIKGAIKKHRNCLGYNRVFWYPRKGGIESLVLAFVSQIENIYTDSEVIKIESKSKKIYFKNGKIERYDYLISTIPLADFIKMIVDIDYDIVLLSQKLKWLSIFNLNLGLNKKKLSKYHWIYFPEKRYVFFRIGFPHNFSTDTVPLGKSSIYTEVSYLPSKNIDKEKLVQQIIYGLKDIGMIERKEDILVKDINDIKYGYVIYPLDYKETLSKIFRFLKLRSIYSIGRYGGWKYATMEDCILDGKIIAEKILYRCG